MAFLTTTELADIRADMEATLPTTCTISYKTVTADGAGGGSVTWTARGTAIACRLSPQTGGYSGITQERLQEGQVWVLSVANDQTVVHSDKVTVGGNDYRVQQINTDESEITLKRVYVVRWA